MAIGAKKAESPLLKMLKSFGFDPEELERQAQSLIGDVRQQQQLILDSLGRIEKRLEAIEKWQQENPR